MKKTYFEVMLGAAGRYDYTLTENDLDSYRDVIKSWLDWRDIDLDDIPEDDVLDLPCDFAGGTEYSCDDFCGEFVLEAMSI